MLMVPKAVVARVVLAAVDIIVGVREEDGTWSGSEYFHASVAAEMVRAQNSAGIQTLLDVRPTPPPFTQRFPAIDAIIGRKRSAEDYRTKRVKDARSEAQKEIEDYRKQKEDEFQSFEKEHTSGNKAAEEQADKDTQKQLDEIKAIGEKTGPKVVQDLIKAVMTVDPKVPDRKV
ncbi:hypothetical protein B0A54_03708 [Friedmanniomyces endolithicus]|uniref:V-type proton ATPase subunit G n=1 Tax=Friedmanniomyces endolithicus TaxID=329885 RepID=A0A4U0VDN2_9PEZI|nr:hypothetical protein B0A54_03708 [Friedmanniomyces endolithicus]